MKSERHLRHLTKEQMPVIACETTPEPTPYAKVQVALDNITQLLYLAQSVSEGISYKVG